MLIAGSLAGKVSQNGAGGFKEFGQFTALMCQLRDACKAKDGALFKNKFFLPLMTDVKWNSLEYAGQRVLKCLRLKDDDPQKAALLSIIGEDGQRIVEKCMPILTVVRNATNILQSNSATVLDTLAINLEVRESIRNDPAWSENKTFQARVSSEFEERFKKNVGHTAAILTLLYFTPFADYSIKQLKEGSPHLFVKKMRSTARNVVQVRMASGLSSVKLFVICFTPSKYGVSGLSLDASAARAML